MPHTVDLTNNQMITGKQWRKESPLFNSLPFNTDLLGLEEMAQGLNRMSEGANVNAGVHLALLVCKKLCLPFSLV